MRRLLSVLLTCAALLATTGAASSVAAADPGRGTEQRQTWITSPDGTRLEPAAHGGIHGSKRKAAPSAVTGTTQWVILRCAYQTDWSGDAHDGHADPVQNNSAYFDTMFSATTPGLANYWHAASYGAITVTHTVPGTANEWRTLPHPNSEYGTYSGGQINIPDTKFNELASDCASVWNADVAFNANTYYGFTLDQSPGACGVGGSWPLNLDGVQRVNGTLIGNCQDDEALWSHEMGHAYGLQHSEGPDGSLYSTSYDIMSAPSGDCPPAGSWWNGIGGDVRTERTIDYGCIPGQPLAYHKAKVLGWIPANRQYKNLGGSHTITLERLAAPTTNSGYLYAELPAAGGGYYTVEARIKTGLNTSFVTGYDENFTPQQAYAAGTDVTGNACVVINHVTGNPNTGLHVRLVGTGSGFFGDAGQCWTSGETWSDGKGASVKVNSNTLHSFNVTIASKTLKGFGYHPVNRSRLLDTRTTNGGHHAPLGPGASLALGVLGRGGVPATGVGAVVLFVRSMSATAASTLTVYADGTPKPGTTNLEVRNGRKSANLVTIKPGPDGKVRIWNQQGSVNVVADVVGYYGALTNGLLYNPIYPQDAWETGGGPTADIPAHQSATFDVTGHGTIPPSGVTAAAIQVSVIAGGTDGSLTSYPAGGTVPSIPDYQFKSGDYHTGLSITGIGANGDISVYNGSASQVTVEVEVTGWYGSSGMSLRTVTPARVSNAIIGAGATVTRDLTGVGGVPATGAKAVLTNVTGLPIDPFTYIKVRPTGTQFVYGGRDLSYQTPDSNAVMTLLGSDGNIQVENQYAKTRLIIDVFGWFANP